MPNFRVKRIYNEDGLSYILNYVQNVKKVGQTYQGRCPFHNEKTGSFTVYPKEYLGKNGVQDHETFYCYGCGKGGDLIKFRSLLDNSSYEEALIALEKEFGFLSDEQGELDFISNELKLQKNKITQLFNFEDISLLIASYCRKYLIFVKDNYPLKYNYEVKVIDTYFRYVDYILERLTIDKYNKLFQMIKIHLLLRRQGLNE